MKTSSKNKPANSTSPRAAKILKALRESRRAAVEAATIHRTPIVYLQDGKLVKERPRKA